MSNATLREALTKLQSVFRAAVPAARWTDEQAEADLDAQAALAADDAARGEIRDNCTNWLADETLRRREADPLYTFTDSEVAVAVGAWEAASRAAAPQAEPCKSVVYRLATQMGWKPPIAAAPQSVEPVAWLAYDRAHQLFIVGGSGPHDIFGGFPVFSAPPTAPTDAEWLAEHERLVDSVRVAEVHSALAGHTGCATRADPVAALAALRAHIATRPDSLVKAAINLLAAVDQRHDEVPPLKYTIPYGAVNELRAALPAPPTKTKENEA